MYVCSIIAVQNFISIYSHYFQRAGIVSLIYSLVRSLSPKPISGTGRRAATEPQRIYFGFGSIQSIQLAYVQCALNGQTRKPIPGSKQAYGLWAFRRLRSRSRFYGFTSLKDLKYPFFCQPSVSDSNHLREKK